MRAASACEGAARACAGRPGAGCLPGGGELKMRGMVGAALIATCLLTLWLVRPRQGEVIALMRGETAQMGFMMSWIVVLIVGIAMTLEHLAR
jgi:hypothetical protein